jgi:hypothetical protein
MSDFGLHRLSNDELKRLLRALHRGALPSPITRSALIEKAFGHIEADLEPIVGRDVESAKTMIGVLFKQRAAAPKSAVELSYMGAPAPGTRSRDLLEQARTLITSATKRVELSGLDPADSRGLLRTVAAVREGRGVAVRLVFRSAGTHASQVGLAALLERTFRGGRGSLEVWLATEHALGLRALVVDAARALVTSGNLDAQEDDQRIELGALIHDTAWVAAFHAEWDRLVAAKAVLPSTGVAP